MPDNTIDYLAHHGLIGQKDDLVSNIELDDDFLEHYQIKGAKHGIRRFQNYDGSLTPAGRERYGIGPAREAKKEAAASAAKNINKKAKAVLNTYKEKRAKAKEASAAKAHEMLKEYARRHPKYLPMLSKTMTKDEINKIVDDINFDQKLRDIRQRELDEGTRRIQRAANTIGAISNLMNNSKNLYNNSVEIYNSIKGTNKRKIGEKKEEDRSEITKIIRSGSADDVYKNISRMTSSELGDAIKRLNAEEVLKNQYGVKVDDKTKNKDDKT